jgi:SNF2 family DNA or RNA helicase
MSYSIKSSLRDNKKRGNVGEFLKENISKDSKLAIVSAYFTIYAYDKLKDKLDSIDSLRFLFGEPRFISSPDPAHSDKRQYKIEDDQLVIPITDKLDQHKIAKECHDWLKEKAEIKSMVKPNFLHGKMYHITPETKASEAILGSSNFTVNGLGLGRSPNIELNMQITDSRDRDDILQWFDEIWNDNTGIIEDVKEEVLQYIQQLYAANSPEFIYYKTMYHLFSEHLEEEFDETRFMGTVGLYDSQVYKTLYSFQRDGVKGIINKLEKHGGCILADSVGLGKTYEALAVIKHYESRNKEVLVLCPKKLKDNWSLYQSKKNSKLNPFPLDRFGYSLMYHTDLSRDMGYSDADGVDLAHYNWAKFDLVVIDESHNLRGNPRSKQTEDGVWLNRVKFLLEKVIKEGPKTKVLMLSATPVNTTLMDLRNQIYFITEEKDDALEERTGIISIEQTLVRAQKQFFAWSKGQSRKSKDLMSKLDASFFKLLDELTIARSRKHILNYYHDGEINKFPTRNKPISLYPNLDTKNWFYSYDQLSDEIEKYQLSIFNPQKYILLEHQEKYEYTEDKEKVKIKAFTQKEREFRLIGMMKVGLLKRLESSVHSFALTLGRTADKIDELLSKIEAFEKDGNVAKDFEFEELFNEDLQDELEEYPDDLTVGKKFKYMLEHLDLQAWKADLIEDRRQMKKLYNDTKEICSERDAKLQNLKEQIINKVRNPINNNNRKVLIFTAFSDSAEYLYHELHQWAQEELNMNCALVSGGKTNQSTINLPRGLAKDFNSILSCFAPTAKARDRNEKLQSLPEIDILIGTDCISEGQNLQDCDTVINYDIHWNPVRVIQRFGRIDRLNSHNDVIQLINYWPTKELDKYINLKQRVETRMALVDATATGSENPLGEQFDEDAQEDESFRSKQLKSLQEEIIDLEDMEEGISLTEFNLDDFRIDLMNHLKDKEKMLKDAPLGLFALAPSPNNELWQGMELSEEQRSILQPGIIFCFRILADGKEYHQLNPVHPYFLLYITDDGSLLYQFSNVKQILEIYRIIALGRKEAIPELCRLFNSETNDGLDMQSYNELLKRSLLSIRETISQKENKATTERRDAVWGKKQDKDVQNFELITWLIIK